VSGAATALRWRQETRSRAEALRSLCQEVGARGWLDPGTLPVIIRVGQRWRTPLVVETARSLAASLADRFPGSDVQVADIPMASASSTEPVIRVAGSGSLELSVPASWFDAFLLVTVTGVGPDPLARMHGVLAAQAEPLRRPDNGAAPDALVYEAHRLGASDLVIACGCVDRFDDASEAWWVASPCDVAAEVVVARACGLAPERLPVACAFASHETLPTVEAVGTALPALGGVVAAASTARARAALARVSAGRRSIVRDLRTVRQNLGKIPNFVRRKLAARRGMTT